MKRSPETFELICDGLANGMSYNAAALSAGVASRTFWEWIKSSKQGDPDFVFEYLGSEMQLEKACNAARRMFWHETRSIFERRCLRGHEEVVTYMGQVQWQVDRRCVGIDDPDIREMLGYSRDGLLRNAAGEVMPLTIHHQPPVAAVLRGLEMAFPEWRPSSTSNLKIDANVRGVVGIGVMNPASGPMKVPAPPPLPQLEIIPQADALAIPETDDDVDDVDDVDEISDDDDVTDTEPEKFEVESFTPLPPQPPAPEPERVITGGPLPEQYQPTPQIAPLAPPERAGRPLSDLERDLLTRSRSAPAQRSAPILVQPKLDRGTQ